MSSTSAVIARPNAHLNHLHERSPPRLHPPAVPTEGKPSRHPRSNWPSRYYLGNPGVDASPQTHLAISGVSPGGDAFIRRRGVRSPVSMIVRPRRLECSGVLDKQPSRPPPLPRLPSILTINPLKGRCKRILKAPRGTPAQSLPRRLDAVRPRRLHRIPALPVRRDRPPCRI